MWLPQGLALKFLGDDCVVGRLPWLQMTVYPMQPKAIVELKEVATSRGGIVVDMCRFCGEELDGSNRCKACSSQPCFFFSCFASPWLLCC
jgi:hypothetical protein